MGSQIVQPAAIVTGAATGIGLAIALRLHAAGWAVTGVDTAPPGEELAQLLAHPGSAAQMIQGDVRDPSTCERAVAVTTAGVGWINALVNNAAADGPMGPIEDTDLGAVQATLDVNLLGAFRFCAAVIPELRQAPPGSVRRIVNIGSCFGLTAAPRLSAYNASKAALRSLTQTAALELAADDVTVNMVAPGYVRTGMLERDAALRARDDDGSQIMVEMAERVPLGRLGRPEDIADLVAWLLSPQSGYITGQSIGINGGLLLS